MHPQVRRAPPHRRTKHTRDHAQLETLRRPRTLPAPYTRIEDLEWRAWPTNAPTPTRLPFERTAGPPLPNTLGTAWPDKSMPSLEWPITGLPAPAEQP